VEIESELDRYIAFPGQALSYMVGRLEIQRLRAQAERRLGSRFDIKSFHNIRAAAAHSRFPCWTAWWPLGRPGVNRLLRTRTGSFRQPHPSAITYLSRPARLLLHADREPHTPDEWQQWHRTTAKRSPGSSSSHAEGTARRTTSV
jgi:uncharacterized protein DUF885